MSVTSSESLLTECSKENLCPALLLKTPASVKYSMSVKPRKPNGVFGNSQGKPLKTPAKVSAKAYGIKEKEGEDIIISKQRNIDAEIDETEKEINRLSTKLKALQIEKAEQNTKSITRSGRIEPRKAKISDRVEDGSESLGPFKIQAGVGSRQQEKLEMTLVRLMQSRRKSCFSKLQDIEEGEVTKRSSSLSPPTRRISSIIGVKQPATTAVSKRSGKNEYSVLQSIHPKKLIKDFEKSIPHIAKRPLRSGRIVASRYSQRKENSSIATENRKRSLPENCKDDGTRYEKRRVSSELSKSKGPENRVKKRWEIPSEIVVYQQEGEEKYASYVAKVSGGMLPKIRTNHYKTETPRDSGPAKRVSELINCRTNFFIDKEMESSICQELNFFEDDDRE